MTRCTHSSARKRKKPKVCCCDIDFLRFRCPAAPPLASGNFATLPLNGRNHAEIDLPEGHEVVVDDGEVDLGESMEAAEQEELKWTDKGNDLLLQRDGAPAAGN